MQNIDQSHHSDSNQDWQILGELKLTVGLISDRTVHKWFFVILSLLPLHPDFTNKVLSSAQETLSRTLQADSVVRSEQIHVIILVPEYFELDNQSWGFFRIERSGDDETALDHTIEFFLYQEK